MRFFTADYIFPISSPPIKNGVVVVHDDGTIEDVLSPLLWRGVGGEASNLQTLAGIICPGFINAHCHLELSHLKGKFQEGKGLPNFIGNVISQREEKKEIIAEAIAHAEDEMIRNAIVAVGDICNTTDTITQKEKNRIRYHNFIEIFDLNPDRAVIEFAKGKNLLNDFQKTNHSCSIVPHAPYSVSQKLFELIREFNKESSGPVTIHNQETESENEMFLNRSGALFEKLSSFGNLYNDWQATRTSSLAYIINNFGDQKTLLVHNTYTTKADLAYITSTLNLQTSNLSWCFCPNANLFIENRLPDFRLFEDNSKLLLGTDSYASNWSLSILDEMKSIQKHDPKVKLEEMLKWATLNGAEFFNWEKDLGSLEKGKKPGVNLISNIDQQTMTLNESSVVKPLLN